MRSSATKNCHFWHRYLPTPYELAEWKQATVQFNYHISFAGMLYSVPHEYIKRKVDVRVTDKTIEIFYNHNRIASPPPSVRPQGTVQHGYRAHADFPPAVPGMERRPLP